jgi:hypothetical protein
MQYMFLHTRLSFVSAEYSRLAMRRRTSFSDSNKTRKLFKSNGDRLVREKKRFVDAHMYAMQ